MNVRELKEVLNQLDDDSKVITNSSNYEQQGSYVSAVASIGNYIKVKEKFKDDFDGSSYSSEVYIKSKDGKKIICIR